MFLVGKKSDTVYVDKNGGFGINIRNEKSFQMLAKNLEKFEKSRTIEVRVKHKKKHTEQYYNGSLDYSNNIN